MEKRSKKIVILAAGDFPSHPIPLQALREADFVVCCDSAFGAIKKEELIIKNYVVIGDGDSLLEEDKQQLGNRWIHIPEQDYNDLHKAMAWATSHFSILNSQFSILGATGKREDHSLGNISYLVTFAEEYPGADICMLTDHGTFIAMRGERTFPSFPQQQVSIFVLDSSTSLTSSGLRWPLQEMHPRTWWQASLNESQGDTFSLTSDGWFILFQTFAPKI